MEDPVTNNVDSQFDDILLDPMKRAAMRQRLVRLEAPRLTHSGSNEGKGSVTSTSRGSLLFSTPPGVIFNPSGTLSRHSQLCHPSPLCGPFQQPPKYYQQVHTEVFRFQANFTTAGRNPTPCNNMESDHSDQLNGHESDYSRGDRT